MVDGFQRVEIPMMTDLTLRDKVLCRSQRSVAEGSQARNTSQYSEEREKITSEISLLPLHIIYYFNIVHISSVYPQFALNMFMLFRVGYVRYMVGNHIYFAGQQQQQ